VGAASLPSTDSQFVVGSASMKMRQSLAQLEQEFMHQRELESQRLDHLKRTAAVRSRERKKSSKRFYVLTLSLILTAVLVTVAMFATLYLLLS